MSKSIMSVHKVSQFVELLALIIFIGMLGLDIVFVVKMIFGNGDWVANLRWNIGNGVSVSCVVLLTATFTSLCLMLWLVATPLRYANIQLDTQARNQDVPETVPNPPVDDDESYLTETKCHKDATIEVEDPTPALERTLEYSDASHVSFHPNLPETIMEHDPYVNGVKENHSIKLSTSISEEEAVSTVVNEISYSRLEDTKTIKM